MTKWGVSEKVVIWVTIDQQGWEAYRYTLWVTGRERYSRGGGGCLRAMCGWLCMRWAAIPHSFLICRWNWKYVLLQPINDMLKGWKVYPISWLIRMPKLLYLFETLPVEVPMSQLKLLKCWFLDFIWNGKAHQIASSVVFSPRNQGLSPPGLARRPQTVAEDWNGSSSHCTSLFYALVTLFSSGF